MLPISCAVARCFADALLMWHRYLSVSRKQRHHDDLSHPLACPQLRLLCCQDTHTSMCTRDTSGDLSVLFDVGGVAGGVMAGHLSDKTGASAVVSMSFTLLSIPVLWMYRTFGHTCVPGWGCACACRVLCSSGVWVSGMQK